ncbi:MAG: hypothetical protein QOD83_2064 [Solirubrobacteraceae bacterium]|jgi:uncharacterized membrane protein (DUF2068 family)|nr:hypothetical protein [Solirubrobacteraceae bacterium]MEA2189614.1 hypothetical protein [Solirubrobacteraceae bacterium]MEA2232248.1 hypothetical protein [Solirubrobacteraceae bacterium]
MVVRQRLPGVKLVEPRRLRPKFHYELLVCGLAGHELIGIDARRLSGDTLLARELDGVRWHRCLRCDSWLPVHPPAAPARELPPAREEIDLPLRGKPLRDVIVLRLIAINRGLHFVVLGLIALLIFFFASHRDTLRGPFYRVLADLQIGASPNRPTSHHGLLHDVERAFSLRSDTLKLVAAVFVVYALVEGIEALGLWHQRRWAEYLTLIVTASLLPLELYELSQRLSALKVVTIVINLAVVAYLLWAKRLFGLRGGVAAEHRERENDVGWPALERSAPEVVGAPQAAAIPGA